jgi:predicted small lipoprotein YifL
MMKITLRFLLLVVMVAMVAGCGASGNKYVIEVQSAADIDKKMAEDGAVSMKDFAAARAAEARKKTDLAGVESAALLTVDAALYGMQFAPAVFGTLSAASSVAMAYLSIGDLIMAYGRYLERKNSAYAALKFDKPLEIYRVRDSENEFFADLLGTEDFRRNLRAKMAKCGWLETIVPVRKRNNGAYYRAGTDDSSITMNELLFQIKYSDHSKTLPETDPCSVKEAEMLLMQRVALILGSKAKE